MSVMRIVRAVHELHELACRLKKHIGYFQHEVVVLYNLVFFVCAWKNCVNFPKRSQELDSCISFVLCTSIILFQ